MNHKPGPPTLSAQEGKVTFEFRVIPKRLMKRWLEEGWATAHRSNEKGAAGHEYPSICPGWKGCRRLAWVLNSSYAPVS